MPQRGMVVCPALLVESESVGEDKTMMKMKIAGFMLLMTGLAGTALAKSAIPESSVGATGSAMAVLMGAVMIIRGRRKK